MAVRNLEEKNCTLLFDIEGGSPWQSPAGKLSLQKDVLVFEFLGQTEPVIIPMLKLKEQVLFEGDRIHLLAKNDTEHPVVLIPKMSNEEERFAFYSLSNQCQLSSSTPFAKPRLLCWRFDDLLGKLLIIFQLFLPFLIYLGLFFLNTQWDNHPPVLDDVFENWKNLVFSPFVGIHYLLLLPLSFFALVWSHRWALLWITVFSFMIFFGTLTLCIVKPGNYYLALIPYMTGMSISAFYYIYVVNKF